MQFWARENDFMAKLLNTAYVLCLDVLDFKNSSIVADFLKGKRIIFLINSIFEVT